MVAPLAKSPPERVMRKPFHSLFTTARTNYRALHPVRSEEGPFIHQATANENARFGNARSSFLSIVTNLVSSRSANAMNSQS